MDTQLTAVFFFQVAFTMVLTTLAYRWWVAPRLRKLSANEALGFVLLPGAIRYMGTILLVPAMAPGVAADWGGAIGDVASATIALAGVIASRSGSSAVRPLAWLYVVVGGGDLVVTFVKGLESGLWPHLAGGWTFVVMIFPSVVLGLVLTVAFLLQKQEATASHGVAAITT